MEITNLEQFQEKLNTITENKANRNFIIENEIKEIENFVNHIPVNSSPFKKHEKPLTINKSPRIFDLGNTYIDRKIFNESFYDYLNNGKPIIIERLYNDNDEIYRLKQNSANLAIEFFKYYKWLKELTTSSKKSTKNKPLYLNDKLLALHFLGLDTSDYDNNKCAEILGQILGVDSENIRKSLSYLHNNAKNNPVRTKNNLEKSFELFENQGLNKISKEIKSQIEKL